MVTLATVEQQLKAVGCNFRFWGRAELRELCQILLPGETIAQVVNGQYEAGFALLCATDFRVLLIDKKPKYLTLKDIRYDMITELDFSGRMMNSTIRIYTPNKELRFTTTSAKRLRKLFTHVQHKMMEIRHRFMMQQFQQRQDIQNTPPGIWMAQMAQGNQAMMNDAQPSRAEDKIFDQAFDEKGQAAEPLAARQASPEQHRRLTAAMGAAGLKNIVNMVQNGQVIKEYVTSPLAGHWRRRPYGYSHGTASQSS